MSIDTDTIETGELDLPPAIADLLTFQRHAKTIVVGEGENSTGNAEIGRLFCRSCTKHTLEAI
tara:strand:+ start:1151 stop:1339 length:189 start_codon:yes stop_codon:yes gene_type:complete